MNERGTRVKYVMVAAFDGWNDACQSATDVIRHLVSRYRSLEIGHINKDGYYDYQSARPMQCTIQGSRCILWPQTVFYDIAVSDSLHILAQLGPEPNYQWLEYCRGSLRFAEQYDVECIVTLGSMLAECPHTRPLPIDISNNGKPLDPDYEYNGPIGITHALDMMAIEQGFNTTSLWVSIPRYLGSADPCPQATLTLLRELGEILGLDLPAGTIENKAKQWRSRCDVTVRNNVDFEHFVSQLERDYDLHQHAKELSSAGTPMAAQLVQEAEAFLRDQD